MQLQASWLGAGTVLVTPTQASPAEGAPDGSAQPLLETAASAAADQPEPSQVGGLVAMSVVFTVAASLLFRRTTPTAIYTAVGVYTAVNPDGNWDDDGLGEHREWACKDDADEEERLVEDEDSGQASCASLICDDWLLGREGMPPVE